MKINDYRLKNNTTIDDLKKNGFKESSSQKEHDELKAMSKYIGLTGDIGMYLTIDVNPMNFDDLNNISILDDAFGQPYTPFYEEEYYKKDVTNFKFLEKVIAKYNEVMDSFPFFEKYH